MAKFQEIESAVVSLDKQVKILTTDLQKLITTVNSQSKSQVDLAEKTKAVKKATKEIDAVEKQRLALLKKLKEANSDRIQKNVELQVQLQKQNKTNKDLAKEKLKLISVYDKESKKLNDLRKKYKDLIVSGKGNEKATKALGKQVGALDKKLKGADAQAGQFQRNVGNYPGVLGRAQSSVQQLSAGFKALLANPVVLVMAAIVGAFVGLTKALKRSEDGQNALNKIGAVLGATLDVLLDIVTFLAEGMINAFKDPKKAVEDLWQAIKTNLVNRIEGLANLFIGLKDIGVTTFKLIGASIKNVFQDNQAEVDKLKEGVKDAAVEMGQALIQVGTGFDEEQQGRILQGFKDITKEIALEADAAGRLADRQAALDKLIRENLITQQKVRAEINNLREIAAQKETISAEERLAALDEAIRLENELEQVNIRIAQEKANIKKEQNALAASTKEDLDEEAQLVARVFEIEATAAKKRKSLESERVTALREVKKEEEDFWKEFVADAESVSDELEAIDDAEYQAFLERLDKEKVARIAAGEDEIELAKEIAKAKEDVAQEAKEAGQQIASDQFAAFIDDNLNKFLEAQDTEQDVLKDKLDKGLISEAQFEKKSNALKLKSRQEQAKAGKKKALFDIAIATAVAAVEALPVLPLVAAVIALGAIEAGVVAAKPIPKFKHGSDGMLQLDTTAIVGDGGKPELVTTPQGSFISPAKDTMVHLPRGSQVFGGDSPETQAALSGGMSEEMYNGLVNEQRLTRKAIQNQPKEIHQITGAGYKFIIEKNNHRTIRRDKYFG